jgi:2-keto-4-pentenoate hydratase/2-oxohepta-3-ene-1,7-dioic acid hydratase in catechol pathway
VAVIGKRVRRADAATALASVAGYTVGNDVSGSGLAARHPNDVAGQEL